MKKRKSYSKIIGDIFNTLWDAQPGLKSREYIALSREEFPPPWDEPAYLRVTDEYFRSGVARTERLKRGRGDNPIHALPNNGGSTDPENHLWPEQQMTPSQFAMHFDRVLLPQLMSDLTKANKIIERYEEAGGKRDLRGAIRKVFTKLVG